MENQKAQLQNSKKRKQNTWEKRNVKKGNNMGKKNELVHLHFFSYFAFLICCFFCFYFAFVLLFSRQKAK